MSKGFVSPSCKSISTLMAMFFDEGLEVTESDSTDLSGRHIATFLSDEDELVALCACDRPFVVYAGAALSMIPAGVANEMIDEGEPNETILANYHEVMNICSKLLMADGSAHLRLDKTLPPEQSADTITNLNNNSAQTFAFGVNIPGYGTGLLTFLVAQ